MRASRDVPFGWVSVASGWLIYGIVDAQGPVDNNFQNLAILSSIPLRHSASATTTRLATDVMSPTQAAISPERNAKWVLPPAVHFDEEAVFQYNAELDILGRFKDSLQLLLVQTKAIAPEPVTSANSWVVVQLRPCPPQAICREDFEFDVAGAQRQFQFGWTFELNEIWKDHGNYRNFFLCWASRGGSGHLACQSFSNFFNIDTPKDVPGDDGKLSAVPQAVEVPDSSSDRGINTNNAINPSQIRSFANEQTRTVSLQTPTDSLELTAQTPIVTYKDIPDKFRPTIAPQQTSSASSITVTSDNISATSIGSRPTNAVAPSGGSSSLSKGATVGIALGVLVVVSVLAAMALFFCLKRRRRAQNGAQKHEKVMLTHGHGHNNSQDLLAEKDAVVTTLIHPNSNDSAFSRHDANAHESAARQTLIPAGGIDPNHNTRNDPAPYRDSEDTRDTHVSTYSAHNHTSPSNIPFVAATPSSIPRRKPTNASIAPSAVSALSRNTSSSTTASRPRSPSLEYQHHSLQDIGEETITTSTNLSGPRYGDARHTPTFHTGGAEGGVSIIPHGSEQRSSSGGFLSEPGMSATEVARLEEEERRIDEAIAAADEQRARERGLR